MLQLWLFCYTKDGVERGDNTTINTGGTGQAIRIASSLNIPVVNLGKLPDNLTYDELFAVIDRKLKYHASIQYDD